ncbi:MAG: hypothetical protein V5A72_02710 [Candidatus Nanohaloarchaea archaeon]
MENELIQKMLRDHRTMKNTEEGYWTLSLDPKAVEKGITETYDLSKVNSIALFTDGVDPALHVYEIERGMPYDFDSFLEKLSSEGVEETLESIEAYERKDSGCEKHIRFKTSDDKALVYVEFL